MSSFCAVIGNPIAHSLSPIIHQHFAQQTGIELVYEKILGDELHFEHQIADFFAQGGKGINVTLPFKQRAYALANNVTKRCKLAGAANTLWMNNAEIWADNTDGIGLIRDLLRHISLLGKKIVLLGGGGAARGIIHPLLEAKPDCLIVAVRDLEKTAQLQKDFPQIRCAHLADLTERFDLVINATSASLAGEIVTIPEECMHSKPLCYDLSYKLNEATPFSKYAQNLGCQGIDGLGMLVEQAAESFSIWHGVLPQVAQVLASLRRRQLKS